MNPILMVVVDIRDNPMGLSGNGPEEVLFDGEVPQVPRPGDLITIPGFEPRIVRGIVWQVEHARAGGLALRSVRVEVD